MLCLLSVIVSSEVRPSVRYKNIIWRFIFSPCAEAVISPACPKVGVQHSHCQLNSNQQTKME